jgi:hypothetical protein
MNRKRRNKVKQFEEFINEATSKSELKRLSKDFKLFDTWEKFVKGNFKEFKKREDVIRKFMKNIKDEKDKQKYFQREMRILKNLMTELYSYMKENKNV